jgi:peroxiredoxin
MTLGAPSKFPMRLITVLGFLFLASWAFGGCSKPGESFRAGSVAPDFRLNDLAGGTVFLNAELKRPVVLTFFATWCMPCREEVPFLIDLSGRYGDKIRILCLDVDPENIDKIRSIAAGLKIPYPILLDEGRRTAERYGVRDLPATFLIGTDGRIRSRYEFLGDAERRSLTAEIERLIGGSNAK